MTRSELLEIAHAALVNESLKRALYDTLSDTIEGLKHMVREDRAKNNERLDNIESYLSTPLPNDAEFVQFCIEMKQGLKALKQITGSDLVKVFTRLENLEVEQERLKEQHKLIVNSLTNFKMK